MFNLTTTEEKIRFVAVIGVEKIEEMRKAYVIDRNMI